MKLDAAQRAQLLEFGRVAIARGLAERGRPAWPKSADAAGLDAPGASFVTLSIEGALRGCCGTLQAIRPVGEDVWRNAWASAFSDTRFAPLTHAESTRLHLQVSVLSPLESLAVASERELLAQLRPQVDGLVLELGATRVTFLPSVWEQLPEPAEFLQHLKVKAGWAPDFWSSQLRVQRYAAESFGADF